MQSYATAAFNKYNNNFHKYNYSADIDSTTSWNATNTNSSTNIRDSLAMPSVQVIVGGAGSLSFMPTAVQAPINTVILFNFLALNHTLTQSSLRNPCESIDKFDTGFNQFNPENISGKYIVEYKVISDKPQWFYCAQTNHCDAGMVFALNAGNQTRQFIDNINAGLSPDIGDTSNSTVPELDEDKSHGNLSMVKQPPISNLTELIKNGTERSAPNFVKPPCSNITEPERNNSAEIQVPENTTRSEIPTISIPDDRILHMPANTCARSRGIYSITFLSFIYAIGKEIVVMDFA